MTTFNLFGNVDDFIYGELRTLQRSNLFSTTNASHLRDVIDYVANWLKKIYLLLKEQCHVVCIPAAHRKLEILHLYFFKLVNPRWRPHLVRRTGESEGIQAERENTNVLTAHN